MMSNPSSALVSCASGPFAAKSFFNECCSRDVAPTFSVQDAVFDFRVRYHWDALRVDLARRRRQLGSSDDSPSNDDGDDDDSPELFGGFEKYAPEDKYLVVLRPRQPQPPPQHREYLLELQLLVLPSGGHVTEERALLHPVRFWLTREEIEAGRTSSVHKRRFRAELHWYYLCALSAEPGRQYQFALRVSTASGGRRLETARLGSPFFLSALGGAMTTLPGDAHDKTLEVRLSLHYLAPRETKRGQTTTEGEGRRRELALTDHPATRPDADRVHFFFVSPTDGKMVKWKEVKKHFTVRLNGQELCAKKAITNDTESTTGYSVSVARTHWWSRSVPPTAQSAKSMPDITLTLTPVRPNANPGITVVPCALFAFAAATGMPNLPYAAAGARVLLVGDAGLQAALGTDVPEKGLVSAVAKVWANDDPEYARLFRKTLSPGNHRMLEHFFSVALRECPPRAATDTLKDLLFRVSEYLLNDGPSHCPPRKRAREESDSNDGPPRQGVRSDKYPIVDCCCFQRTLEDPGPAEEGKVYMRAQLRNFFTKNWSFDDFELSMRNIIGDKDDGGLEALWALRASSELLHGRKKHLIC